MFPSQLFGLNSGTSASAESNEQQAAIDRQRKLAAAALLLGGDDALASLTRASSSLQAANASAALLQAWQRSNSGSTLTNPSGLAAVQGLEQASAAAQQQLLIQNLLAAAGIRPFQEEQTPSLSAQWNLPTQRTSVAAAAAAAVTRPSTLPLNIFASHMAPSQAAGNISVDLVSSSSSSAGDVTLPRGTQGNSRKRSAVTESSESNSSDSSNATPAAKKSKKKQKKTSQQNQPYTGPLSVPCRCRNMPDDHNPRTAYIMIPHNVQHGRSLECSHPVCRSRGIRFRYCSTCERPVAKRNFASRHSHEDVRHEDILAKMARGEMTREGILLDSGDEGGVSSISSNTSETATGVA